MLPKCHKLQGMLQNATTVPMMLTAARKYQRLHNDLRNGYDTPTRRDRKPIYTDGHSVSSYSIRRSLHQHSTHVPLHITIGAIRYGGQVLHADGERLTPWIAVRIRIQCDSCVSVDGDARNFPCPRGHVATSNTYACDIAGIFDQREEASYWWRSGSWYDDIETQNVFHIAVKAVVVLRSDVACVCLCRFGRVKQRWKLRVDNEAATGRKICTGDFRMIEVECPSLRCVCTVGKAKVIWKIG